MKTYTYTFHTELHYKGMVKSFWLGNHHNRAINYMRKVK